MAFAQHIIDFVDALLPPARRQTGAERCDSRRFERSIGVEPQIAPRLPAGKAARLMGQAVQGMAQSAQAAKQLGGVHRFIRRRELGRAEVVNGQACETDARQGVVVITVQRKMLERIKQAERRGFRCAGGSEPGQPRRERTRGAGLQREPMRGDDNETADSRFRRAQNHQHGGIDMARQLCRRAATHHHKQRRHNAPERITIAGNCEGPVQCLSSPDGNTGGIMRLAGMCVDRFLFLLPSTQSWR